VSARRWTRCGRSSTTKEIADVARPRRVAARRASPQINIGDAHERDDTAALPRITGLPCTSGGALARVGGENDKASDERPAFRRGRAAPAACGGRA
jgi:hypothetical protein